MMKHSHPNFPSDIFIILETVSAKLNISMFANEFSLIVYFVYLSISNKQHSSSLKNCCTVSIHYKVGYFVISKHQKGLKQYF